MSPPLRIRELRVWRLGIPLRLRFEHAAASRSLSDPVVIEVGAGAPFAHYVGYGETLVRAYVTGETVESAVDDISHVFAPLLETFRAESFAEALDQIEALPYEIGGRVVTGARAAVELALLDLAGIVFRRRPADAVGWLGLPGFGPPGCLATARYSGIAVGRTPAKLRWLLRLQLAWGLRDFKLKVGVEGWAERLATAASLLRPALAARRATLRVDANAAWSLAEAHEAVALLEHHGVCALEQPLPDVHDEDLPYLAEQTTCDLIADESLLTLEDARRLIDRRAVRVFNIRIAKNGGLLPALRMARLALAAGLDVQLGCLVGETSILSAAGLAFLEACPKVRFVEGAFGRLLLRDDVVRRSVRFGWRGRARPQHGFGLGVNVDPQRIQRYAVDRARTITF